MSADGLRLYSYWRSSAAYRVRIALNLKGLPCEIIPVHLTANGGEQHSAEYAQLNPQEFVPTLLDGGRVIRQSMAIIEYLDESYDGEIKLLPPTARDRARVRGLAQLVACDIHPLNNLRVLTRLRSQFDADNAQVKAWIAHWIGEGFGALEQLIARTGGRYAFGDTPTFADCYLVPQVYNAERYNVDLAAFPRTLAAAEAARALPAFAAAHPDLQPDFQ